MEPERYPMILCFVFCDIFDLPEKYTEFSIQAYIHIGIYATLHYTAKSNRYASQTVLEKVTEYHASQP